MEIGPLSNHQTGQEPNRPEKPATEAASSEQPRGIVDQVDISLDARARLAQLADQELEKERSAPTPIEPCRLTGAARIEAIRRRVETGYYEQADVQARIADRIIDDWDS